MDVVTVGHALMDIRVLVAEFTAPDRESEILATSYGSGGSAANTAVGVTKLGRGAGVIARVAKDSLGRLILEELSLRGVDVGSIIVDEKGLTGFSIIIMNQSGDIMLYSFKGVSEELTPGDVDYNAISNAKCIHIASLRLDTSLNAAMKAKSIGVLVTWDPGRRLTKLGISNHQVLEMIRNIDIILVNEVEACTLVGVGSYREAAARLLGLGVPTVIVKRGGRGVYASSRDQGEVEVPPYSVRAIDTTGAGDAFAAGLIVKLIEGVGLRQALEFANAVAAIKVTRLGAQAIPSRDEAEVFMKQQRRLSEVFSELLGRGHNAKHG